MKIFLVSNTAWSLINFRRGLVLALKSAGHEPVLVAPFDENVTRIQNELDVRFIPLSMDNQGTNPLKDTLLMLRFWRLIRLENPDLIINYTIKPVIYCAIVASMLKVPVISVITGLGTAFLRETILTKVVEFLYKVSQRHVKHIFFLNKDDFFVFKKRQLASVARMSILPGEGVDVNYFSVPSCISKPTNTVRFLLMARMLWDKGVGEYVIAARLVKEQYREAEFALLGFLDVDNCSAISREQMLEWEEEGVISYLGVTNDVRSFISDADCIVLPSYREGVPRTLLEAAAMAKPVVTTDAVGCRDVVDHGINGYLCRIKDPKDLAEKLIQFINLSTGDKLTMGMEGRKKIEQTFDEKVVIGRYFDVIEAL
jgi:glycosyltransferase involved in cell wall biosynthesis